jgi:serine/threonine protein kinase
MADVLGRLIDGKYRVVRPLGGGGVAEIYEAVHEQIGQRFAVKVLRPQFAKCPEVVDRFLTEARAASAVRHPGVVKIVDIGQFDDGTPYLVMEYLDGESLHDLLRRKGVLSPSEALGICIHVLDALEAAHRAGVVHRDLKPENIFLVPGPTGEPWARVIDFGVASLARNSGAGLRATAPGMVLGTPYYMAPEQARGVNDVDGRADIYAVGVVLFEMLTGRLPFEGASVGEILTNVLSQPFPSPRSLVPSLSSEIDQVLLKAVAPDRANRYGSPAEFAQALRETRHEAITAEFLPAADDCRSIESASSAGQLPATRAPVRIPAFIGRTALRPTPNASRTSPVDERTGDRRPISLTPPPIRRVPIPPASRRRAAIVAGVLLGAGAAVLALGLWDVGGHESRARTPVPAVRSSAGAGPEANGAVLPRTPPVEAAASPSVFAAERPAVPDASGPAAAPPVEQALDDASKHSHVRLVGLPPGAEATVDGRPVEAEFALDATNGEHTLRVRARGFRTAVRTFRAPNDMTLEIVLERVQAARQEPTTSVAPAGAAPDGFQPLANPFEPR